MDIAVVGAGIIGRLMAFKLLKAGHNVTLFDKDTREGLGSCSYVGAGLLVPFGELERGEHFIHELGLASIQQWKEILSQLTKEVYFQEAGHVLLGEDDALLQFKKNLSAIDNTEHMQALDQNELQKLEPELNKKFTRALYFPGEAQLSAHELLVALEDILTSLGIKWFEKTTVTKIGEGFLITEENEFEFDVIFDCRGLGAKKDIPNLRGVRGELIWVEAKDIKINRPIRLLHPTHPVYIIPRPDNIYILGASTIEKEDMSPVSEETISNLLTGACSVHEGFQKAKIIKKLSQCRPALSENTPKIFYSKKLIRLNGFYRNGYLLAPAVTEQAMLLLSKGLEAVQYPELIM